MATTPVLPGGFELPLEPRLPRHVLALEGEALRRRFEELLEARDPEDLAEPEAA